MSGILRAARRALHAANALTTVALLGTGLLISYPEARGWLVGGYGHQILELHLGFGWAYLASLLLIPALAPAALLDDLRRRLGPPDPLLTWKKIHLVTTLFAAGLAASSGLLLWLEPGAPAAAQDAALGVHVVVSWVLLVSIPVHLALARGKIVARTREILGIDRPPLP